ncbi:hypothetical protein [Ornithinimicrobium pratense]|uniref:Uncharacterized protein n=1 Tax=Ornithinimicrobium pratense TaxID=2593973 RepID=A0A5J6V452_9MICO|nr:hypothetical protein [Ornithinimicrobium pratense]QFG67951.1 hypothetical protein FY030_03765 [Ornithinimicrobium pratense]
MRPRLWDRLRAAYLPFALLALGVGALLYYIGSLPHTLPAAVLVVLLGTAVLALIHRVLAQDGRGVEPAYWVSTPHAESTPPAAMDYRLLRLRRDLRDALEREDRPDHIYPVLRELTAERLRARHDIDLDDQPELARQVLSPGLIRYLDAPPTDTRRRSRSALHHAIEGIEKL